MNTTTTVKTVFDGVDGVTPKARRIADELQKLQQQSGASLGDGISASMKRVGQATDDINNKLRQQGKELDAAIGKWVALGFAGYQAARTLAPIFQAISVGGVEGGLEKAADMLNRSLAELAAPGLLGKLESFGAQAVEAARDIEVMNAEATGGRAAAITEQAEQDIKKIKAEAEAIRDQYGIGPDQLHIDTRIQSVEAKRDKDLAELKRQQDEELNRKNEELLREQKAKKDRDKSRAEKIHSERQSTYSDIAEKIKFQVEDGLGSVATKFQDAVLTFAPTSEKDVDANTLASVRAMQGITGKQLVTLEEIREVLKQPKYARWGKV